MVFLTICYTSIMQPQTFVFFGLSGSGKGTQSKLLINDLKELDPERKILYLETGNKLRSFIEEASLTSRLAKEVLGRGELVPEFIPIWLWTEYLIRNLSGDEHLFIDGSPRKLDEAHILDLAVKFYKRENPFVISIEVSDGWATERLLGRGRDDDNEEEIKKRLGWYKENVVPAIEYFKSNTYYKFISINGEQTIEEVHREIAEKTSL